MQRADFFICGASVRAAIESAAKAGHTAIAVDLFGDVDTRESAIATHVVENYPEGFLEFAKKIQANHFVYTGGLENWPRVVKKIAEEIPIAGNNAEVLSRVRNPFELDSVLHENSIPHPQVSLQFPGEGVWLRKSMRSCGGLRVELADVASNPNDDWRSCDVYFQEFVPGESTSAVFVASDYSAQLIGSTLQLHAAQVGSSDDQPFTYRGSIGPRRMSDSERAQWQSIGNALVRDFKLNGIFGVDAILSPHDRNKVVMPIEVNPRFVASAEIFERAYGWSAIASHLDPNFAGPSRVQLPDQGLQDGKLIVYAKQDCVIPVGFREAFGPDQIADIPSDGFEISAGQPICTTFVRAEDEKLVLRQLLRMQDLIRRFVESDG